MNNLEKLQYKLAQYAVDIYTDMSRDLDDEDMPSHFRNMGDFFTEIYSCRAWDQLVDKVLSNEFAHIGVYAQDILSEALENMVTKK